MAAASTWPDPNSLRANLYPLMAARRRGPRRPKTISASSVTGQKGINLIERIVLDMESRWTPSGQNEVGIDGYIELFDPATRIALGLTLAAQSKVVNAIAATPRPASTIAAIPLTFSCQNPISADARRAVHHQKPGAR
jgi:hypothetical protein